MVTGLSFFYLVPGILAMTIALASAAYWRRRFRTSLGLQVLGGAGWLVSVAAKLAWALPTNEAVHRVLGRMFGSGAEPIWWLYLGLLTGVFEVGATLLIVRSTRLRRVDRPEAVSFGIGFGAAEALALALVAMLPVLVLVLAPALLPPATKATLLRMYAGPITVGTMVTLPVERASALVFHTVSCALVIHGFRVGRPGTWFAVAFLYKSAVDAVAAWAVVSWGVTASGSRLAAFEIGLAALAALSALVFRAQLTGTTPPRRQPNLLLAA
jgi:uncharacterized membrane protein YhfC